ncbi:MAG: hypothetical protein J0I41_06200 [Filimonas sp.]|nr:hypothetical protein [Filimonas sp.]
MLDAKYAPAELQQELQLLKRIMEANHPSLYWYTPKDSIDYYFSSAINSIHDSLTTFQFKNKIAWVISKIRCGHTSVRFPDEYIEAAAERKLQQFPLSIKTWKDSLVALGSLFRTDSIFKRGTIITSINGHSGKQILDSMFQFVSTDGYSDNFKSQLISTNFPAYYKNAWGLSQQYTIRYIDTAGAEQETTLRNYDPKSDTQVIKRSNNITIIRDQPSPPTRKEKRTAYLNSKRSLSIDTTNSTAYMRVATFSEGHLRNFFRRSFKQIGKQHIKHLIVDLRENSGGSINVSTKFARYIADHSFKVADTVAAISRRFRYGRYIHPSWVYWVSMHFTSSHHRSDDKIHLNYFENHRFDPLTKDHFDGNVYVLQGGFTFSAAAMFVSHIKGQKNVTIVGEETGGAYYGNTSVHLPSIKLPLTKVNVVLPMYRVVLDHTRVKDGQGIKPDIEIEPTSEAIRKGFDLKLRAIREKIQRD